MSDSNMCFICDSNGCLLLQTVRSNLSLFNVSCHSDVDDESFCNEITSEYSPINTLRRNFVSSMTVNNSHYDINYNFVLKSSNELANSNDQQENSLRRWKGQQLYDKYL
ncbi:unnamed protein product [Didymodactylos carnosus]|uniref:Uncharacterized protein n=1 Tax=Didymodactylos carnosus TaxID=1234261 RepID=A0A813ULR4_9BILA|nr:unnamed protein product [Didymodactylos carnosus]CAF0831485.1 unnamed protein product [Didymodactylos carnosus]CAF3615133.1 unnamed protein product [Didymodactylos carnosus]CAF3618561.1 unnamed protein product [Didymodactylos carnosus]